MNDTGFSNSHHAGRATQAQFGGTATSLGDPFNYPMPGRKDLMSLSTIDWGKDNMKTTTRKFQTRRFESTNLNTQDITGNRRQ